MENLSPCLILLWEVQRSLEKGQSVQSGIKTFLKRSSGDNFFKQVEKWTLSLSHSQLFFDKSSLSISRRYLLEILELGLQGQGILEMLKSYELELIESCEDEIQTHISRLPLILMLPLMGLIFPSLMMLIIGPLLSHFAF